MWLLNIYLIIIFLLVLLYIWYLLLVEFTARFYLAVKKRFKELVGFPIFISYRISTSYN